MLGQHQLERHCEVWGGRGACWVRREVFQGRERVMEGQDGVGDQCKRLMGPVEGSSARFLKFPSTEQTSGAHRPLAYRMQQCSFWCCCSTGCWEA